MISTRKERYGTVEVADPDLGGAGVEVKGAFFVDLGGGVRRGKDLDADLGRAFEQHKPSKVLCPARSEPSDIDGFDSGSGGSGAFREDISVREELLQEGTDPDLAVPMKRSWRRSHKEVTVLVGLNAIGELRELGIGQDLGPTSQVEPGLRLEIGELNGDGHEVTKSMKAPRKQSVKKFGALAIGCIAAACVIVGSLSGGATDKRHEQRTCRNLLGDFEGAGERRLCVCHQKKVQLLGASLAESILYPVLHRHLVFGIPKMLHPYFRYDRDCSKTSAASPTSA